MVTDEQQRVLLLRGYCEGVNKKRLEGIDETINDLIETLDEMQDELRLIHGGELCDCGLGQTFCDKSCEGEV